MDTIAGKFHIIADLIPDDDECPVIIIELAQKAVGLAGRLMRGDDKGQIEKELDEIIVLLEVEVDKGG